MTYEIFVEEYEALVRKALLPMTHEANLEVCNKLADLVDANIDHERRYEANLYEVA